MKRTSSDPTLPSAKHQRVGLIPHVPRPPLVTIDLDAPLLEMCDRYPPLDAPISDFVPTNVSASNMVFDTREFRKRLPYLGAERVFPNDDFTGQMSLRVAARSPEDYVKAHFAEFMAKFKMVLGHRMALQTMVPPESTVTAYEALYDSVRRGAEEDDEKMLSVMVRRLFRFLAICKERNFAWANIDIDALIEEIRQTMPIVARRMVACK